jgi:hypothetical protein
MLAFLIFVGVVVAGVVAFKLWKSGKAVTVGSVAAGVEADVVSAANTVANTVSSKL